MTLTIEAPTDAQFDYIRDLCRKAEQPLPDVIHSKTEASEIIARLQAGTYDWQFYALPLNHYVQQPDGSWYAPTVWTDRA